MALKTIFLDRDGVINKEKDYLYKIKDFEFISGVFVACKNFINLGYQIIIVTNQSGISRGFYSENDFYHVTNWMLNQFHKKDISILDILFCPHSPSANCACRKPEPGMFFQARDKHDIDMTKSWMIGDRDRDIKAANRAGISNTILVRSGHQIDEINSNAKFIIGTINDSVDIIVD